MGASGWRLRHRKRPPMMTRMSGPVRERGLIQHLQVWNFQAEYPAWPDWMTHPDPRRPARIRVRHPVRPSRILRLKVPHLEVLYETAFSHRAAHPGHHRRPFPVAQSPPGGAHLRDFRALLAVPARPLGRVAADRSRLARLSLEERLQRWRGGARHTGLPSRLGDVGRLPQRHPLEW